LKSRVGKKSKNKDTKQIYTIFPNDEDVFNKNGIEKKTI
jgi:hypothetical protein